MEQGEKVGQLDQTLGFAPLLGCNVVAHILAVEEIVQACLQGVRQAELVETGCAFPAAHPVGGRWDAALDQARLLPVGQQFDFEFSGQFQNERLGRYLS